MLSFLLSSTPCLCLSSLPDSLGAMVGLVELFLTDNQLTHLPESMGNLKKLFKLQVRWGGVKGAPLP